MPGLILLVLLAFGLTPFVIAAVRTSREHQVFLGVAGVFPFDQDQYLAFVSTAHDGLIRNLYGLVGSAVFIDPIWSPSGIVRSLTGVGYAEILAFWNVVGACVLFSGAWRLVSRHIPADQPWRRSGALALALFGGLTVLVTLGRSSDSSGIYSAMGLDMVPAQTIWGYAPMAIAIGVMPFAIEAMERVVAGTGSRRNLVLAGSSGLLVGWLHPWQGITLFLVWVGLIVWRITDHSETRPRRRQLVAVTVCLIAAPVYFEVLPLLDRSWAGFSREDRGQFALSWEYLVYGLAPMLLVGLTGVARVRHEVSARGLLLWPFAVLVLLAAQPPEILHCFDGLALPVAVLTLVRGESRSTRGQRGLMVSGMVRSAWLLLTATSTVLITISLISFMQTIWLTPMSGVRHSDLAAARLAARHADGHPVLTSQQLGVELPVVADTATWSGDAFWTPNAHGRMLAAARFLLGDESPPAGRAFVARTGARAVIEPCGWKFDLNTTLTAGLWHERTDGCAHVYWRR